MGATTMSRDDVRARWEDVLRSYAASLEDLRLLLATTGPDGIPAGLELIPAGFEPPLDLPPCPEELLGWAHALLAETSGLAQVAAEVLERHPVVSPVRRMGSTTESKRSAFMDTRL